MACFRSCGCLFALFGCFLCVFFVFVVFGSGCCFLFRSRPRNIHWTMYRSAFFRPTPSWVSPGRSTSLYLPEMNCEKHAKPSLEKAAKESECGPLRSPSNFFFFGRRHLAFAWSPEAYSRTSGESNHHRQSVRDTRVPQYQLGHKDTLRSPPDCPSAANKTQNRKPSKTKNINHKKTTNTNKTKNNTTTNQGSWTVRCS